MKVTVNGEAREFARPPALAELLRDLGADGARVAVLVNGSVVPAPARHGVTLADADVVEVLTLAAGG
jgi:sulfur carrier protein